MCANPICSIVSVKVFIDKQYSVFPTFSIDYWKDFKHQYIHNSRLGQGSCGFYTLSVIIGHDDNKQFVKSIVTIHQYEKTRFDPTLQKVPAN